MNKPSLLIDINGVLYVGEEQVEGASGVIDFLRENRYSFRFISNASRACKETLCGKLQDLGLRVHADEIFNAPTAAVKYIKDSGKNRCFLLTAGDVYRDFEKEGVVITGENPDYVVVGDAGENFTFKNMNKAFNLLLKGAGLIAMEKDRYWRTSRGLALSAGPFVKALEYGAGREAMVVGKPSEGFFKLALQDMDARPAETMLVGDDIDTDIVGAQGIGMKGVLVKTGKYRGGDLGRTRIKPDAVLDSIADLEGLLEKGLLII